MKKFTDDMKEYSECWDDEASRELIAAAFIVGGASIFTHAMHAIAVGDKQAIEEISDYFKKHLDTVNANLETKH